MLHAADAATIDELIEFIRRNSIRTLLDGLLPGLSAEAREDVLEHCHFSHAAALVFPRTLEAVLHTFEARGLVVNATAPSVIVRRRLAERYGRSQEGLDVTILRAPVTAADEEPCEIELFVLCVPEGSTLEAIAERERAARHEVHVALDVRTPGVVTLSGLCSLLPQQRMLPDGGDYNPYDDATTFYFRDAVIRERADVAQPYHRLELRARGQHAAPLASHRSSPVRAASVEPARRLLELMTGAWTTQALAAAAQLRLADHLSTDGGATLSVATVAERVGADRDGLRRLLRLLAMLGVVAADGDAYTLTELGALLREDAPHSLRPLALLYGGVFYQSFAGLEHSVRTGREAFQHLFGAHHFVYFAERPALSDLFNRAMAASRPMFSGVAAIIDLSRAKTVIDVAGGNGELLGTILNREENRHLKGILFDRPHVIEAARSQLMTAGCLDRCELRTGDFTRAVPEGGDAYVLSRVLHDWDDAQCLAILRQCANAMPSHAELYLVERILPADDRASLAVPWDVHMLCNVGGRERTAEHYRRLLHEAEFEWVMMSELPLDGFLIQASKRTTPAIAIERPVLF